MTAKNVAKLPKEDFDNQVAKRSRDTVFLIQIFFQRSLIPFPGLIGVAVGLFVLRDPKVIRMCSAVRSPSLAG